MTVILRYHRKPVTFDEVRHLSRDQRSILVADSLPPPAPLVLRYFQRRADTGRPRVRNQARVRDLALGDPEVTVFCSHDPAP